MFSGIITHTGSLVKRENSIYRFKTSPSLIKKLDVGISIAVDGACLTVSRLHSKNSFSVDAMPETAKKTIIGQYEIGNLVNLELPATPTTYLSGHIVQGHIDGTGTVKKIEKDGNSRLITIQVYPSLIRYIVAKGSIAINGISLTVIDVTKDTFTVGIIPYTWSNTMFHTLKTYDRVNLEVNILAKYVENLLKKRE